MGTILIVVLVLLLIGALPAWPYSGGWGRGLGLLPQRRLGGDSIDRCAAGFVWSTLKVMSNQGSPRVGLFEQLRSNSPERRGFVVYSSLSLTKLEAGFSWG